MTKKTEFDKEELPPVGRNLKLLRAERRWSLDVTNDYTGVSKAMLGQIERGESSPTLATLWKLATGFKVPLSSLLMQSTKEIFDFLPRTEQLSEVNDDIKVKVLFAYDPLVGFEVFELSLPVGHERLAEAHKPGVIEHIVVVSGTVEVLVKDRWHCLSAGDRLRFSADVPHGYRNKSSQIAVFHDIIHYV